MTALATDRATQGYALGPNEGECFALGGLLQTIKISGADTGGRYGMIEVVVPEGFGPPLHLHTEEDEWFYVLEGNLTAYVGDARLDLTAGGFGFGPHGVPHTFVGAGPGAARVLVGLAPMQFEGLLREVGQPAPDHVMPPAPAGPPPDHARLAETAKRHGIIILGPPGPPRSHVR